MTFVIDIDMQWLEGLSLKSVANKNAGHSGFSGAPGWSPPGFEWKPRPNSIHPPQLGPTGWLTAVAAAGKTGEGIGEAS